MTAAALLDAETATPAGGCDELPGDELIRRFEAVSLGGERFRHADHVRLTWEYHRRLPAAEALARLAGGLRRFAAAHGKPERYHETITWAFALLVRERMELTGPAIHSPDGWPAEWAAFCTANPDLFDREHPILDRYYRPATLASDLARRVFLMPDRIGGRMRSPSPGL
jgi:hypothetical protein